MCRVPQHAGTELMAQGGTRRILHGDVLPPYSSPTQTPLSVPALLPALQITRPAPANLLQPKPLTRRWTWQACPSGLIRIPYQDTKAPPYSVGCPQASLRGSMHTGSELLKAPSHNTAAESHIIAAGASVLSHTCCIA